MTTYVLYILLVTAMNGTGPTQYEARLAWRPSGEFTSKATCENAIKELKLNVERAKCLPK